MGQHQRFAFRFLLTSLSLALVAPALVALSPVASHAQIRINEIYPDPAGADEPSERVEIYNAGLTAIDVTGWCINDAASIDGSPTFRCRIPEDFDTATGCSGNAVIQPGEFRLVKWGPTTPQAWLNQGGDDVYLCSNRTLPFTIVHQVTYPSASGHTDEVWACLPNGSTNFAWRTTTLCATNGSLGDVTAPGTVSDLLAVAGAFPGEIRLTWTAPGDDGATGTATLYEIKVAHGAINSGNFESVADVNRWIGEPVPAAGGSPETLFVFGLDPDSSYTFALMAQDEVPNASGVSNNSSTLPAAGAQLSPDLGYNAYFGNLHSHTSYSDGQLTPADAFNYARNTAQTPLDFLCVSEHNHSQAGMSLPSYALGLAQAAAANEDGQFVAIYGQEWGIIASGGHATVFESPKLFGWEGGNYDVFVAEGDYVGLYNAAVANPSANYPVVVEWCHPVNGDFNDFALTQNAKQVVRLMALVSGPAFSTNTSETDVGNTGFDDEFGEALRKGFHVSPTGDQDNHNITWGASTEARTAVLSYDLTKSAILEALAEGRNYATQDHNAVVEFSAENRAMGRAFGAAEGVRIVARVTDPDPGDAVAQIDLLRGIKLASAPVIVATSIGNSEFSWRELDVFPDDTEVSYYLRIRMADNQNIWTGPVFVTYDATGTVAVEGGPGDSPGLALAVSPVPARGPVSVDFTLPMADDRATLGVYDIGGRLIRNLANGSLTAGTHHVRWDGLSESGARAGAGIFFIRLQSRLGMRSSKILLLN